MRALFFLFVSRICNLSADGHSLTTLWAMAAPLTPFLFHPRHLHLAQRTAATGHNDNREDSNRVTNHALSQSHPLQCTTTVIATTATMTRRCGQRPPRQRRGQLDDHHRPLCNDFCEREWVMVRTDALMTTTTPLRLQ